MPTPAPSALPAFDTAFHRLLKIEGVESDDPNDLGGHTKFGVTEAVAKQLGIPFDDSFNLAVAGELFHTQYWAPLRLDEITVIDTEVAFEMFEEGVNFGISFPARSLKRCLNTFNRQQTDYRDMIPSGPIDDETINALKKFASIRGTRGLAILREALNCMQGARYIEITEARMKNEDFIFGWFNQRVMT